MFTIYWTRSFTRVIKAKWPIMMASLARWPHQANREIDNATFYGSGNTLRD